jgi:hypothetical protein
MNPFNDSMLEGLYSVNVQLDLSKLNLMAIEDTLQRRSILGILLY